MKKRLLANAIGWAEQLKRQFNGMIGHKIWEIVGIFPQIDTKKFFKEGDFTAALLPSLSKGINLGSNVQLCGPLTLLMTMTIV